MSELLRAVLTETSTFSRAKWYTAITGDIQEPSNQQTVSTRFRVENGTYFMVMSICLQEALALSPSFNPNVVPVTSKQSGRLSIYDVATGVNYQKSPVNLQSISHCMNSITDLDEYFVIPSDRDIGIDINCDPINTNPPFTARNYEIVFVGIEYKFAKKINLDHMRTVAMAYTPPPLQKHNDFVPFL